MYVALARSTW